MRDGFEVARALALALPGVEEGRSYGTPAFRVRGKLFARLHQDGNALVVRSDFDERDALLQVDPRCFFITEHHREHPWVLVRLGAIGRSRLEEVLRQSWRLRAPGRLVEALDAGCER